MPQEHEVRPSSFYNRVYVILIEKSMDLEKFWVVNIRDKGLNKFIYEIVLKKKKVQDHNKHEALSQTFLHLYYTL